MNTCSVQDPWFTLIREGLKTVEGRLCKGRFAKFKKGDTVQWFNANNPQKKCVSKITNIVHYPTFEAMLKKETVEQVLPGVPDVESGVKVYRRFYTKEKESEYGILAIHLDVIHDVLNKRKRTRRKKTKPSN